MNEPGPRSARPAVLGSKWAVTATHYHAATAALRVLDAGGNAVDAGVAGGLCLCVLDPHVTNLGGVAPIMVYEPDTGEIVSLAGLGTWPRSGTLESYLARYGGDLPDGTPQNLVPGGFDAWIVAMQRYGTKTFAEVSRPALDLAADGFPLYPRLHYRLSKDRELIARRPDNASVFLSDGNVPPLNSLLRQPALARTIDRLAAAERRSSGGREAGLEAVRDTFYRGELAREMVAFCQADGGLLTLEDFAQYEATPEPTAAIGYGDAFHVVTGCPWSQGPTLLLMLKLVEGMDVRSLGHNSLGYLHGIVEAIKLSMADRERYFGDPKFVRVPLDGLLSETYAAERRGRIDWQRAWPELPPAGTPPGGEAATTGSTGRPGQSRPDEDPNLRDTSYVAVVDAAGLAFSATPSDPACFSPIVPSLGIAISTRGRQFWLDPAHPSVIAPGKRPRLTPFGAMVLREGKLFMATGCPGGDGQTQALLQTLLNVVEFRMDPQEAIEAPRVQSASFPNSFWPHVYTPNLLTVEEGISDQTYAALAELGHAVERAPRFSPSLCAVCSTTIDPATGTRIGAADPRHDSYALAG